MGRGTGIVGRTATLAHRLAQGSAQDSAWRPLVKLRAVVLTAVTALASARGTGLERRHRHVSDRGLHPIPNRLAAVRGAGVGVIAAAGRNSRNRREASANASAQADQIVKNCGRARLQRSELIQRLRLACECAGRIIAPANRVKSCSVEPGRSADRISSRPKTAHSEVQAANSLWAVAKAATARHCGCGRLKSARECEPYPGAQRDKRIIA